ncbi:hypothetical protein N7497_000450 [Penicillium chrysogenum]|nr:hypothetical protein N7497_000450 [Penicillium chrysogenum]
MSQLMARDLRMNTELRKIILEEDDEDEDNLSRQFTIFTMKATSYEQHMGYVFLPEASPGMPEITSSKVQDLQRALAVLTADTVLLTELGGVKICE